ncbi:MAG: TRAP transporter small permease subunit, partial [Pseudomonadota bacterium]
RLLLWLNILAAFHFIIHSWLKYTAGWPGAFSVLQGATQSDIRGWIQLLITSLIALGLLRYVLSRGSLTSDCASQYAIVNFIIRWAFLAIMLVGIADAILAFMRVEDLRPGWLAPILTSSSKRALLIHYPLLIGSIALACFWRRTSFVWLALLVVIAELFIVILRFIFSYEQAFMGDLVRFWYAALFLLASAQTLFDGGHVRVDILYTLFTRRVKSLTNTFGCLAFGLPLCWVILAMGMGTRNSVLTSPLLSFEGTQSSFGLSVKYFMAGFLMLFALCMLIMFTAYCAHSIAHLRGEKTDEKAFLEGGH